jgi:hypothetical protein
MLLPLAQERMFVSRIASAMHVFLPSMSVAASAEIAQSMENRGSPNPAFLVRVSETTLRSSATWYLLGTCTVCTCLSFESGRFVFRKLADTLDPVEDITS